MPINPNQIIAEPNTNRQYLFDDIKKLGQHEKIQIGSYTILSVPGGWIYTYISGQLCSSVFVPR